MDFDELRAFIAENIDLKGTLGEEEVDAVFLLDKPEEVKADQFIVYSFNELNGGHTVRQFVVQLKLCCKTIPQIISLKDSLTNLLDFYNRPCEMERYKKFVLSNEGGIFLDENTGYYINNLYFDCKLI